ncbi:hypothetical protein [Caulobacter mirabilis]|uniref:Integral membrane protein n=1 Tax=Caulobacter mirabilis TaxID=69666 RepID=A0A2D2AV49_9CAUL|nr:hypothetical protein [Caulobacter mirabilis]ATQ41868.1 hypothetical protein CSW64_05290 [Caulobacter mirabilis]
MTDLSSFLRRILAVDAVTCTAAGALMAFGAGVLAPITGLPQPLLLWAGVILFPVAALMAVLSRRATAPTALVWLVILGNAGWVAASIAVLFLTQPTALGTAFVVAQAAAVAVLTVLEWRAATTRPSFAAA